MPLVYVAIRRTTTLVAAVLLLMASSYTALLSLGLVPAVQLDVVGLHADLDLIRLDLGVRLTWLGIALLGLLLGMFLLAAAAARGRFDEPWVVLQRRRDRLAGNSVLRVSSRALHAMLAHSVERVDGVRDARPQLRLTGRGWDCRCLVQVADEVPLTDVAAHVETAIRHGLERHTGHAVRRVDVNAQFEPFNPRRRVA